MTYLLITYLLQKNLIDEIIFISCHNYYDHIIMS